MNQEINFYRDGARPRRLPLGTEWMAWASLGGVTALHRRQFVSARHESEPAGWRHSGPAASDGPGVAPECIALLHPEPKPDPALVAEVERAQRMVDGLNESLQTVNGGELAQRGGFAAYFESLAHQAQPDVWLTGIQFKAGGKEIELAGVAQVSDGIPKWVQSPGAEAAFRAKTFADFVIKRPEQQQGRLDFVLRTHTPEAEHNGKH